MKKKIPKQIPGLCSQSLHPSETDGVLEYFPPYIPSPSLFSLSLSDLPFMPMETSEALWIPGECEISLAGQQPGRRQTPARSCGTRHRFLPVTQRGSAARVRKSGRASAKSLDVNKREEDGQRGTLEASHRRKMTTDKSMKAWM